jgi:ComF family protein
MRSLSSLDCAGCHRKRFGFQQAVALGVYGGELRDVVLRIKRTGNEALGIVVARQLAIRCREHKLFDSIDLLTPTPIHWIRRMRRGGSCPELLTEAISAVERIPAARTLVRCRRSTKKQGTLLPSERRQNVRDAFRVSKGYDIKDAHILLVDDVMTTGATANEIAKALRKAGASRITLAVVARGIGFD